MGNNPHKIVYLACWLGLILLNGCTTLQVPVQDYETDWISSGSGVYDTTQGKAFYGVGVAFGIQNRVLLRATADNRARDEMAKVLRRYIAELADSTIPTVQREANEPMLNTLVQAMLCDALIIDHWFDSHEGKLFALCRVDLAAFKQRLQTYSPLDPEIRHAMELQADDLHTELSKGP